MSHTMSPGTEHPRWEYDSAAARLGAELRRFRLELGMSQRSLTRLVGLAAHSNLGDYERGDRIPPGDIVVACERLLSVRDGYLQRLRARALRERASLLTEPSRMRAAGRGAGRPATR